MKTVVLGIFEEMDAARRVLAQLAASPLDLEALEIVHADPLVQSALAAEAGVPAARTVPAAGLAGAVLGGALGAMGGTGPLAALGPLLATAAGALVGGGVGMVIGALSTRLRLPSEHTAAVLEAIQSGATVILIRTDNGPTAEAIGNLFRACGSRELPAPSDGADAGGFAEVRSGPEVAGIDPTHVPAHSAPLTVSGQPGGQPGGILPAMQADAPRVVAEDHTLFAPPWRRGAQAPEPLNPDLPPPTYFEAPLGASLSADPRTLAGEPSADAGVFVPPPSILDAWDAPAAEVWEPRIQGPALSQSADPSAAADDRMRQFSPAGAPPEHELAALALSSRVAGALVMAGITTRADLAARLAEGDESLMAVKGIGRAAVVEIRRNWTRMAWPIVPAQAQAQAQSELPAAGPLASSTGMPLVDPSAPILATPAFEPQPPAIAAPSTTPGASRPDVGQPVRRGSRLPMGAAWGSNATAEVQAWRPAPIAPDAGVLWSDATAPDVQAWRPDPISPDAPGRRLDATTSEVQPWKPPDAKAPDAPAGELDTAASDVQSWRPDRRAPGAPVRRFHATAPDVQAWQPDARTPEADLRESGLTAPQPGGRESDAVAPEVQAWRPAEAPAQPTGPASSDPVPSIATQAPTAAPSVPLDADAANGDDPAPPAVSDTELPKVPPSPPSVADQVRWRRPDTADPDAGSTAAPEDPDAGSTAGPADPDAGSTAGPADPEAGSGSGEASDGSSGSSGSDPAAPPDVPPA